MPSSSQPEHHVERKLAAIFAADVEGYSRLMGIDEVGTLRTLTAYREIIDDLITQHRGRIFNTAGDSVLAEFASVVDAVQCAVEVQRSLAEQNTKRSSEQQMRFRIGLHVGDVLVKSDNLFGEGVNIAARLETLAEPGGICVSGSVRDYIGKKLPVQFTDCGDQAVKNIAEPVRAYRIGMSPMLPIGANARTPLPLPDKPSIAVLPFTNLSGDPEQEYFADGMVEDIISGLSRIGWLFVIARNSSFTYKGKTVDVKQVGRELGVRYVLEGSMRKAGARVRITGQLIDATTGGHIWADRFDGALEDVFDLQDRVTASVVGAIEPRLQRAEIERSARKPTENLDAYDYYLRGLAQVYRWTRDGVDEALRLFYKAIELDPDFTSPYGMAAWCHFWRMMSGWTSDRVQESAEVARLVGRVTEAGKDDAVALAFSGLALGYVAGDAQAGDALIDRALVLNPNLAAAWCASGWLKACHGDPDVSIEHIARAMRLSPLDPLTFFMQSGIAFAHFFAGRYNEAWQCAERACRDQPNVVGAMRVAAASNALAGRLDEARMWIARALQLDPDLRISNLDDRVCPIRPEYFVKYAEALRQAGLPE